MMLKHTALADGVSGERRPGPRVLLPCGDLDDSLFSPELQFNHSSREIDKDGSSDAMVAAVRRAAMAILNQKAALLQAVKVRPWVSESW